jgi:hypothetical protein
VQCVGDIALDDLREGYGRTHASLLDVSRKTDGALFHVARGAANSIGFNLWHVARWDDSLFPTIANLIPELSPRLGALEEIWARDRLAEAWGMPSELGAGGAGTGLPRDDAQGLRLPDRETVLAYATDVFDEFSRTLDRLEADMLPRSPTTARKRTVAQTVLYYWEHAARHLGMIEALRGVLGEAGSARG